MFNQFSSLAICAIAAAVGCSNSSDTSSSRPKKPVTANQTVEKPSDDMGGGNLSCDQQWSLAIKQQRVGSAFVYSGTIKIPALGNLPIALDRTETVIAASDSSITKKIDVKSSMAQIASYVEKLKTPQLTITKDKFVQTCNKANGQPVTVSGLGGTIGVGSLKDETINLKNGKSVPTKRVDLDVTNVTLGSYNVGKAAVVTYVSMQYPILPLKQTLTLNQISESLLVGAVLSEDLVTGLPTD